MVNRARTWAGGDLVEMDGFVAELRRAGVQVVVSTTVPEDPVYPVYHLYNAGWSWSVSAAAQINRIGRPFVVTPIYFPRRSHPTQHPSTSDVFTTAARILVYSNYERDEILSEHSEIPADRFETLLKGIQPGFDAKVDSFDRRPTKVALVCSITPRKNVLQMLQAAKDLGVVPVVAGQIADHQYWARCKKLPHIYAGELDRRALAALYAKTKVVVIASDFDPGPNVLLEAAMAGCVVVMTRHTYLRDVPGVFWCVPEEQNSIREAIRQALTASPSRWPASQLKTYVKTSFDWNDSTTRLLAVYDAIAHRTWRES